MLQLTPPFMPGESEGPIPQTIPALVMRSLMPKANRPLPAGFRPSVPSLIKTARGQLDKPSQGASLCTTVMTTFPFLCPFSTYLKASAVCSNG